MSQQKDWPFDMQSQATRIIQRHNAAELDAAIEADAKAEAEGTLEQSPEQSAQYEVPIMRAGILANLYGLGLAILCISGLAALVLWALN